jgi:hypothetical protein
VRRPSCGRDAGLARVEGPGAWAACECAAPVNEGGEIYGLVGSNDMKAVYQELGTSKIPPRPFISAAARIERSAPPLSLPAPAAGVEA